MRKVRIGLLGLGTVGCGIIKLLAENGEMIRRRESIEVEVVKVLVRDQVKVRGAEVPAELLTTEAKDILTDGAIDIVVECMGGEEPAFPLIVEALAKGKSVVTANKEVVAKHWDELAEAAAKYGAGLYYEASVGGAIPVINAIRSSLQANRISRIMGIINGTTNYILSRMTAEGRDYREALEEAQLLGYAEPDPTADVAGFDARYKLVILSALAFHNRVKVEDIFCQGITDIIPEDIKNAKDLGYVIKLLAIGKKQDGVVEARVHPTLIPLGHPLASVEDSFNAIYLDGNMSGSLMFYGRGAGDLPTASAMVSDILTCARLEGNHQHTRLDDEKVRIETNWKSAYYLRLLVQDRPGVFAEIAEIFGRHGVSLSSVVQTTSKEKQATILIITHESEEVSINVIREELRESGSVISFGSLLRVEA